MVVIIVIIGTVFVLFVECWLYEHLIKELIKSELVKGEGVTSQVIHIIQKTNNMFIDMSQVVHIIQKSNIMSCFHSLHVYIWESIYLVLWCVVSFICVWHHISRYIFNFIYQNNLNLNNIIEAWCYRLPSIPLVLCTTLVSLFSSLNSVPE